MYFPSCSLYLSFLFNCSCIFRPVLCIYPSYSIFHVFSVLFSESILPIYFFHVFFVLFSVSIRPIKFFMYFPSCFLYLSILFSVSINPVLSIYQSCSLYLSILCFISIYSVLCIKYPDIQFSISICSVFCIMYPDIQFSISIYSVIFSCFILFFPDIFVCSPCLVYTIYISAFSLFFTLYNKFSRGFSLFHPVFLIFSQLSCHPVCSCPMSLRSSVSRLMGFVTPQVVI